MLHYGLSIDEGEAAALPANTDVSWFHSWSHVVAADLQNVGVAATSSILEEDKTWIQHDFGSGGKVRCRFRVSLDGRVVQSSALPSVARSNLRELLLEPVMRTVLCRLNLPAFHAAALVRTGEAILLMGPKGAGKSTLSAALQHSGWSLLADDLVRVICCDESIVRALPGMRRNKLHLDSLQALGHSPETAQERWARTLPADFEEQWDEKLLLPAPIPEDEDASFRIAAAVCLLPRSVSLQSPQIRKLSGQSAVLHLARHLIRDPLPPNAPPLAAGRMMSHLVSQASVLELQMPDDLSFLRQSAEVFAESLRLCLSKQS
jgi:hypothetical protein